MAKTSDDKSRLLQILAEAPLIGPACKKVGISRATFYRWMKDNLDFRIEVEKAMKSGRENLNDVGESGLVGLMREKNLGAIKYYLEHNSDRYKPLRASPPIPEINLEDLETYNEAMDWIKTTRQLPDKMEEEMFAVYRRMGFIDDEEKPTLTFVRYLIDNF